MTGYLPSAARNMGQTDQPAHDARYDHADEYLEVLYKLWEGSWEDDAVIRDRERGVFTDPAKVHHIGHRGNTFHRAGHPPVRAVAAAHAGDLPGRRVPARRPVRRRERRGDLHRGPDEGDPARDGHHDPARARVGRPRPVRRARSSTCTTVITGETDEEARAKHAEYLSYGDPEGALVFMSGWMGVDLARYGLDEPIGNVDSNAILSAVKAFQSADPDGGEWAVRDIADWGKIGGIGPLFVGSGARVADVLQEWVDETDVDGFNLAYAITPGSFADFVDHVVPVLTARGAYQAEYAPGTLRNKLFGRGDRLPDEHRGSTYRVGGPSSTIIERPSTVPSSSASVASQPTASR